MIEKVKPTFRSLNSMINMVSIEALEKKAEEGVEKQGEIAKKCNAYSSGIGYFVKRELEKRLHKKLKLEENLNLAQKRKIILNVAFKNKALEF